MVACRLCETMSLLELFAISPLFTKVCLLNLLFCVLLLTNLILSFMYLSGVQSNPYGLKEGGSTAEMSAWTSAGLQPSTGYYPYDPTLAAYGWDKYFLHNSNNSADNRANWLPTLTHSWITYTMIKWIKLGHCSHSFLIQRI